MEMRAQEIESDGKGIQISPTPYTESELAGGMSSVSQAQNPESRGKGSKITEPIRKEKLETNDRDNFLLVINKKDTTATIYFQKKCISRELQKSEIIQNGQVLFKSSKDFKYHINSGNAPPETKKSECSKGASPPFVSIEVIENGIKSEELSKEHKKSIENMIQYNTFMKEKAISKSCCCCESCCFEIRSSCCLKPHSVVCRKKVKPNMYQILGLDMKQELKQDIKQQKKNIKDAFEKSKEKYNGNERIVIKLQEASDELKVLETRVKHVNDYEYGRSCCFLNYYNCCHCDCSCAFWCSLLCPLQVSGDGENHNSEDMQQSESKSRISRKCHWDRCVMLMVSLFLTILGILLLIVFGLVVTTTSVEDYIVAVFEGGLLGAGPLGYFATLNKNLTTCNYIITLALGFLFGASTQVSSHAITEKIHFSKMSPVLEEMLIGLMTGLVGGILSWLLNIIRSFCFERETLSKVSVVMYFCCGPILGVILGGIIGCASGALKVTLTQDTGLDTFTFVSWVKILFFRTQRKCVKFCTGNVITLAEKAAIKHRKDQSDLCSDSVQSINFNCCCCCC